MRQATTGGGLIKTSVQFSPGLIEQVDEVAREKGLSRSAIVTRYVREGLRRDREEEAKQRSRDSVTA